MGLIMKNGIAYGGGSGSSGGGTAADTTHIELTFAEYQELEKQGKVDSNATYFITDDNMNGVNYANAVLYDDTETNIGVNNVQDAIVHLAKNGGNSGDNCSETIELTQAEYDALGETVNSDNKTYYITDSEEELDASMIAFDDSETSLGVHNVQDAIVEQNKNLSTNYIKSKSFPFVFQQNATGIMTVRLLPYVDIGIEKSKIVGVSVTADSQGVYSAQLGSDKLIINAYSSYNYGAETLNGFLVISYID